MMTIRRADDRGRYRNDWLDSRHTFSFGEYYDPAHMGVSILRVINDDRVAAGAGFPTHPHRDMEIVSYVLDGALEHRDSMGNGSVIRAGDVQRMSAGTGVTHSEFNPSDEQPSRFLQIWLLPTERGIEPCYGQKYFAPEEKQGRLRLLVSPDGRDGSIAINSDARVYGTLLDDGETVDQAFDPGRMGYVQVARGSIRIGDERLYEGDGAAVTGQDRIEIRGDGAAEVLLFDLPATA
jgi:hypothetical protein